MNTEQDTQEQMVHGVPARLFDGYDGGQEPPAEFIQKLLAGAPPEIRARAEQMQRERQEAGEQQTGDELEAQE